MSVADAMLAHSPPPAGLFEFRWSCSARACAHLVGAQPSTTRVGATASMVMALAPFHDGQARVECWLEPPEPPELPLVRRILLPRRRGQCRIVRDDGMIHLEVAGEGQPILSATFAVPSRLLYLRTTLLADLGLAGGQYDRPAGRCLDVTGSTII